MHQHKAVAQLILILSILNFVLAAPAVREIHEARDDVIVPVFAQDVEGVSDKLGNTLGGKLAYESRDGELLPGFVSPPSTLPSESPPPTPTPKPGPPRTSTRPKIMTPEKIRATKIVTGVGLLTASLLGLLDIQLVYQDDHPKSAS
jgi:hypothetical protein